MLNLAPQGEIFFLKSPFIKGENKRERKEDMWGYESLNGKADNLTHYMNRKESALKIIISTDASHMIVGGKNIMKVQARLKQNKINQTKPKHLTNSELIQEKEKSLRF